MGTRLITLRDPLGAPLAEITVTGARITVAPEDAQDLPFVAAVIAQLRATAARERPRPSCGTATLPRADR